MNRSDLCAHSATLDPSQKDFANKIFWNKLEQVEELYRRHQAAGNLYLGGSLGLGQPALVIEHGQTTGVKSDIDLFYVIPQLPPSPREQAFLEAVAGLPQDVEVSVHLVPPIQVHEQMYSTAFDDLARSLRQPLLTGFPFPISEPLFESKTMALMVVRMLGTAVAPHYVTTHQYANVPGDRIERDSSTAFKVALTFLRLPCYQTLTDRYSHRSLLELAQQGFFADICTPELVLRLVRGREQVDYAAAPSELNLLALFKAVAARETGLEQNASTVSLSAAFQQQYLSQDNFCDTSHALLLPFALWVLEPDPQLWQQAREAFAAARRYLEPALVSTLETAFEDGASIAPEEATALTSDLVHATLASITARVKEVVARAVARQA